ncbi:MAG: DUF3025 domain-containing protein [Comamonas sp.]
MSALPASAAWTEVDWSAPWLQSLRAVAEPLWQRIMAGETVPDAVNAGLAALQAQGRLAPLAGWRFVPQAQLPAGMAYEAFIHREHAVPTRCNLHDFFNAMVWLHYPRLKRQLNALQAQQIALDGIGDRRGPLRDAATLLDENGALLLAPPALHDALRRRDWQQLGVGLRPLWQQARLLPIGHALLEKLVQPRKSITAHVLCLPPQIAPGAVDVALAAQCSAPWLAQKPFSPLPVLGVPGWWPGNEQVCFYDDPCVFRSARSHKPLQQTDGAPA